MTSAKLARHSLGARVLHALDALVIMVLLASGLALGELLGEQIVALFGGHLLVNATHQLLGLAFVIAWVLLVLAMPDRVHGLLRDTVYFRRRELRWPLDFLRFSLWPRRFAPPFHDGRFDPAQRVIFISTIVALALMGVSGVYLYLAPPLGRMMLAYAIRIHIATAWVLIGCLCIHAVAGSGLLRTHRGLATAMFGDGRVAVALARTLWPGWSRRQASIELAALPAAAAHAEKASPSVASTAKRVGEGD